MALPVLKSNTRNRVRRGFRRRRRDVEEFGVAADEQIERLLIRRFNRLVSVRRFVLLWMLLFSLLIFSTVIQIRAISPYYQALQPAPGGMYSEGSIGTFSNANPLYATGNADVAISRLVFSGLFKYNDKNVLVSDLAKSYVLDAKETHYTVLLKHGITWQDGKPFTADDVVFTYQEIQNPDAQSAIFSNWAGIKVSKIDNYTVSFELPNPLSSFPNSLINGIIPKHLLASVPAGQLRSASFNTDPIGTGPFQWKFVEVTGGSNADREQVITLAPFNKYYAGPPKLDGFSLHTFHDDQKLLKSFEAKDLNAMSGLEALPDELKKDNSVQTYYTPLASSVMTFFNNSHAILNDVAVRKALVEGVDQAKVINLFGYPVNLSNSPLLRGQLGYDPTVTQLPLNFILANQQLDADGWVRSDPNGIRTKDGQPLTLTLSSQNTAQYTAVAQFLQQQWGAMGVKVNVRYFSGDDLQSNIIANHDYDMLLYGISIGVDPDVFAYWDSSQASLNSQGHLNLSEYKSTVADQALEAGRTRSDPNIRAVKYKAFLTAWQGDAPALALYQPDYLYITRGPVFNYQQHSMNSGAARFYNVSNWEIREQRKSM